LCSSFGVDLHFFSGTGATIPVGDVIVDGDVDTRMGISMTAGVVYVAGVVKVPIGNVIEVASDRSGYRKYRSITDVVCNGLRGDTLVPLMFYRANSSRCPMDLCETPLAHAARVTHEFALKETLT